GVGAAGPLVRARDAQHRVAGANGDHAAVAEDEVAALVAEDEVAGEAAENPVAAFVAREGVRSAGRRIDGADDLHRAGADEPLREVALLDDPVVAEDDVVAGI